MTCIRCDKRPRIPGGSVWCLACVRQAYGVMRQIHQNIARGLRWPQRKLYGGSPQTADRVELAAIEATLAWLTANT